MFQDEQDICYVGDLLLKVDLLPTLMSNRFLMPVRAW